MSKYKIFKCERCKKPSIRNAWNQIYCTKCSGEMDHKGDETHRVLNKFRVKRARCHYCGTLATERDSCKPPQKDAFGIKWWWCPCHPFEAQLFDIAVMENKNDARIQADNSREGRGQTAPTYVQSEIPGWASNHEARSTRHDPAYADGNAQL